LCDHVPTERDQAIPGSAGVAAVDDDIVALGIAEHLEPVAECPEPRNGSRTGRYFFWNRDPPRFPVLLPVRKSRPRRDRAA
jgi:hypothetical protein